MLKPAVSMLCTPVSYLHAPDRKADLVDEGYEMQLLIHNRDLRVVPSVPDLSSSRSDEQLSNSVLRQAFLNLEIPRLVG